MSYPIGTTLTRKVPFVEPEKAGLNYLRVLAVSPIRSIRDGEWAGSADGDTLVCTPVEIFGDNETVPAARLREEYDIEFMPEDGPVEIENQRVRRPVRQESPEEAFARMAREKETAETKRDEALKREQEAAIAEVKAAPKPSAKAKKA